MTTRSWLDDELSVRAAFGQVFTLCRAGLRKPVAWAVSIVAFVALVVAIVAISKHSYAPSYLLRVVEAEREPGAAPRPRRQFADYVQKAVFTSAPLLAVIQRHGLYPSLARKNPRAALDSFREDIEVEVYQNYFLEEREVGSGPRSARIRISYHDSNPEVAVAVTRDLGQLIVDHETTLRREQATRAAERAREEVELARRALAVRRSTVALARDEIDRARTIVPRRQVEFVGLSGSLPALELRQDASERRAAALSLDASLERQGIGMSFVVVDDASLGSDARARTGHLVLALSALAFGLPLVTMAVGALGPRKGLE
jgi:hypothetical protein